jgi:hypothetical protein
MAKDKLHEIVREVLVVDGWYVSHDPYLLSEYDPAWEIDFAAEKIIAAQRGKKKIAVEVKSFIQQSFAYEFHSILGQYLNYRIGLGEVERDRALYLAVPVDVFETEFIRYGIVKAIKTFKVKILVYDPNEKTIVKWIG